MKIFIKNHSSHAGKYIYRGYYEAWKSLGYDTRFYENLSELKNEQDFFLMATDGILNDNNLYILDRANKVFLYVQPNNFEMPWGMHPNFICLLEKKIINKINYKKNVLKWTFGDIDKKFNFFSEWEKIESIPLAFDDISYTNFSANDKYRFDVCFIGGRANNGFDEKYKIMLEIFNEFKKTNLKCGFFIDKNLTHEQEKNILYNSKICINIHDAYQRKLGLDTNERTFKSLGVNGILVSDNIKQICNLTDDAFIVNSNKEYVEVCFEILKKDIEELNSIKKNSIKNTINNHSYTCRVKKMLELVNV